jgi:hypothetical protein
MSPLYGLLRKAARTTAVPARREAMRKLSEKPPVRDPLYSFCLAIRIHLKR